MEITAKLGNLRIAPRKVRLVADLIRGKKLAEAQTILSFAVKKASPAILKLLRQAEANAKNNFQLDPANLFIAKILVNEGRKLKRWRPRARGQAYEIQRKTSHIILVLDEIKKTSKKIRKTKAKTMVPVTPAMAAAKKEEKPVKTEKEKFKPIALAKKPKAGERIKKIFRRNVF